jgi:UPF0716 family protein affecting phage T7 exclusion
MNPKLIYIFNFVAVAIIAVLWLTDVIGLTLFIALITAEASLSIWLVVLFMRREKEQVAAFGDLFAAMLEGRSGDSTVSTAKDKPS